jgi:transketolase
MATPDPQPPAGATPDPQPPAGAIPDPQPPAGAIPDPQPPAGAIPDPQPPAGAIPDPQPPAGAIPAGGDPVTAVPGQRSTTTGKAHRRQLANAVRALSMDAVERANSGHPGLPLGMADAATALFTDHLTFDPSDPTWPDRDRFVLSAGHGSMLLYSLLHLTGYDVTLDDLKAFRQLGSKTAGHPEYGHCPGVETTTGPLGQGLATAVGMALAERMLGARYGEDLVDHRTYVLAGDGCLMEGISHEAIDLAGHLNLNKLVVLFDDNQISIDGPTSLATSIDQQARFTASGWNTIAVDGHDGAAVSAAIAQAKESDRPTLISCRTVIGFGAPTKQGTAGVHGSPLGADEVAAAKAALGWPYGPFEVPDAVRAGWRTAGDRGRQAHRRWRQRFEDADPEVATAFRQAADGGISAVGQSELDALATSFADTGSALASRQSSQKALEVLTRAQPTLVGGSADLTGSTGTRTAGHRAVAAEDFSGSYVNYGIREHAMGAVMNGIALHGGFVPYGSTFLAFADYARPSLRLAALMGLRVVHVFTHDSIGLGEDGPTHQPVEHLASLRAIPGLTVIRPADAVETAHAWAAALRAPRTPTALVLSRQTLKPLPRKASGHGEGVPDGVARGGYLVTEPTGTRDVTLVATGSEVGIALAAADLLARDGILAAVVSLPSFELFAAQPKAYRDGVLGRAPRVAVEAAVRQGWDTWLRPGDEFVGMSGFGASGPAEQLYEHFGITATAVADAARRALARAELQPLATTN